MIEGTLQAVPVLELLIAGLSCALMKIVSIKNVKNTFGFELYIFHGTLHPLTFSA